MKEDVKYELTDERNAQGLYRIRALRDIPYHDVNAGDLGGWVKGEENLSQDGSAWVRDNARVYGEAKVFDSALICDDVQVYKNAWAFGSARIGGNTRISGRARVHGSAWVYGNAIVSDSARIYGNAWVYGSSWVHGNSWVHGDAEVRGSALVFGSAQVFGDAKVFGGAEVGGDVQIYGNAKVFSQDHTMHGTVFSSQRLRYNLWRTERGYEIRVGCFEGTLEELEKMILSDQWIETTGEDCDKARPEMLALIALCRARIARW